MSNYGTVYLFAEPIGDPTRLVVGTASLAQAAATHEVTRTAESHEWLQLCASMNGMESSDPSEVVDRADDLQIESPKTASEAAALWVPDTCLRVSFVGERWRELDARLRRELPVEIAGSFWPSAIGCRVGFHDIYDAYESGAGRFISRPFFSISVFGWGHPNDWTAYRAILFKSEVMQEFKAEAEQFCGPLQTCVVFDG